MSNYTNILIDKIGDSTNPLEAINPEILRNKELCLRIISEGCSNIKDVITMAGDFKKAGIITNKQLEHIEGIVCSEAIDIDESKAYKTSKKELESCIEKNLSLKKGWKKFSQFLTKPILKTSLASTSTIIISTVLITDYFSTTRPKHTMAEMDFKEVTNNLLDRIETTPNLTEEEVKGLQSEAMTLARRTKDYARFMRNSAEFWEIKATYAEQISKEAMELPEHGRKNGRPVLQIYTLPEGTTWQSDTNTITGPF